MGIYILLQRESPTKSAIHAVVKGNQYFDKRDRVDARKEYVQAASLLQHSSFGRAQESGRIAGTVAQLGYYFALTGDRVRAHAMWNLYLTWIPYGAPKVPVAARSGNFSGAFQLMLSGDKDQINNMDPDQRDSGEPDVITAALVAGANHDFKRAERLLRMALNCGSRPEPGYALYALGVAYEAMGRPELARDTWLASTVANGWTHPDVAVIGTGSARAMRMLLAFD